ncbi:hypothetical protein ACOSQ2_030997 [Xanthoceras sorbifolium]
MENNPTTHKSESAEKNQNSDRISSLHDTIIYHIFSFLPTLYVVRTSILSKRWYNLWNFLPYVYFDDGCFNDANGLEQPEEIRRIKFRDSVNEFMSRRISSTMSIIKFQLSTRCRFHGSHMNEWISAAIRAGVEELDVCIGDIENHLEYRWPSCLFDCRSLVTLKLSIDDMFFHFPESFCFPNLKVMHLNSIILAKNFHHQLMNCPKLEVLCLNRFFVYVDPLPSSNTFQDLTDGHHSKVLSNLDDAFIAVVMFDREPIGEVGRWLSTLLRKLSNVKTLQLSYRTIKVLQYSEAALLNHLPTFCNLKHLDLELGGEDGNVVDILACVLRRSLVLQSLHLRYVSASGLRTLHGTLKPEEFLSVYLLAKLKKIRVDNFWGTEKQIELVRLLFRNEVLEEIIVHLQSSTKETIVLREELLQFPRLSKLVLVYENSEKEVIEEIFS